MFMNNTIETKISGRDLRFDVARCICMIYVIGIFHLSQYLGGEFYLNNTKTGSSFVCSALCVFSFISGYFISSKYHFMNKSDIWYFYKKRLIRLYPLFLFSCLALWLIGFNTTWQTLSAIGGVGCFVPSEFRPKTLWYISMLLVFYLITPTVIWKRKIRLHIIIVWIVLTCGYKIFFNLDWRFIINLLFYFIGVIVAKKWKTTIMNFLSSFKWFGVSIILYIMLFYLLSNYYSKPMFYATSISGVWLILSLSLSQKTLYDNNIIRHGIEKISYASMCYYLFHRLFYYYAMQLQHFESATNLFLYLFLLAFPIGFIFSYFIQWGYDYCLNFIEHKRLQ